MNQDPYFGPESGGMTLAEIAAIGARETGNHDGRPAPDERRAPDEVTPP
jgi:hypothetical protein